MEVIHFMFDGSNILKENIEEDKRREQQEDQQWDKISELTKKSDCKGICNLEDKLCTNICWVSPNKSLLEQLKIICTKYKIHQIYSVGCGCGLLEWTLMEYCKPYEIFIRGSEYKFCTARKYFIDVDIVDDVSSITKIPKESAILFCYSGQSSTVYKYLDKYEGNYLIVIGSSKGLAVSSPEILLHYKFNKIWNICESANFGDIEISFFCNNKAIRSSCKRLCCF